MNMDKEEQPMRTRLAILFIALLLLVQVAVPAGIRADNTTVNIYDIQYTTDPSGDSPYEGQTVTTSGVVSLVDSDGYVIQDRQGGPWNGVFVYDSGHSPNLGDEVQITGLVDEYYGMTELKSITNLSTLSTDNGIPTVEVTASEAMTEAHEGVLIATYAVTVTNPSLGYGEWEISDASGSARVDDEFHAYSPELEQNLTMVRGVVWYSYGNYMVEPRSAADIVDAATFRIYDIQYPGGDSPYAGETVTVTGIVVGVYPDGYVLEDPSGGPWSGVFVYDTNTPSEGDEVTLTGEISEYYGLTEIENISALNVDSSGNVLPTLEGVSTAWIATGQPRSESYEGVLIATDAVTVTDDNLGYGEWEITDRSGTGARVGDMAAYSYRPVNGDLWHTIRGVLWYSFGDYKIEPRYDDDICRLTTEPVITKGAPVLVAPGELFTYTITVENSLGFPMTDVVITDAVPTNVTFAYALDGGVESDGVVSWNVVSLPYEDSATVRFAVTATQSAAYAINADYAVAASNYVTSTAGSPLVTVVDTELAIHHIQGASHVSPLLARDVEDVRGIVTAKRSSGFYMQDPNPDEDVATSEAIFVYTDSTPTVDVGDEVSVSGTVMECRSSATDLSTTQIGGSPTVVVQSSGNSMTPAVIGTGGRIPPGEVIDDDATGDVETSGTFDPDAEGIDFYESLEGMLVQVDDAVAVGATNKYGEIAVVGDDGGNAGLSTPRGGIVVRPDDFNPERIVLDDVIVYDEPQVDVGASFASPITGVLDYGYGNFKLFNLEPLPSASGGVIPETTTAPTIDQLRVASFNVENLDPGDDAAKFAGLASQIVNNLQSPDLIGLQEVQDNTGPTDDGVVDASDTYNVLIAAIEAAGGPTYDFRDISPEDGQDGGEPGGNIRVGFLFRTDRGLTLVDRPGGDATTAVSATMGATGVELSYNPGRIDPTHIAFDEGRKSLVGEFLFNGHKIFVVVNHLKSKSGDDPLFGRYQPPVLYTETKRDQQAQVVNDFVDSILALDPNANVIVLGDMNDFPFSEPLATLRDGVLTNLMDTLPVAEQYTYIYDGNSQVLDHILVSDNLHDSATAEFDIVHANVEFAYSAQRPSDHDPIVATFTLPLRRIYLPLVMR
jgi:uncharacterized repeat protein (TIGR01451 family)